MAETSKNAAAAATGTGAQPDPLIGRTINDRFKILSVIARGGMGKVYKAEQAPLGRICAVKVLNPNYAGDNDPEFHKRFFLEASIASKLSHPNTVTIFDYGRTDDDIYYMAMEYLEGRTLHRLIREEGLIAPERALHIARQVCRSLREAHGLGVIHRDLKPANIYLIKHDDDPDFVKVLDFGLVKNVEDGNAESLTQTGLFMGSPKYMAPEQIRGEKVTACTDIYALGVVLYEMLTGKVPFDRGNSVNTLMAHVSESVPPLKEVAPTAQTPFVLEELVYKCLAKRAEDRYANMDELLAGLKRVQSIAFSGMSATGEFPTGALSVSGEVLRTNKESSSSLPAAIGTGANAIAPSITPGGHTGAQSLSSPPPSGDSPDASHTPVSATLTVAEHTEPKPNRTPLIAAAIVGVLALGGLGVAMTRSPAETPQPTPHTATTTPPNNTTTPPVTPPNNQQATGQTQTQTPTPPAERVVRVSLGSTPPNAEVYDGTRLLGRTPLNFEWSGDEADPGRTHQLVFRLANYRDLPVQLQGTRLPTLSYDARLQPAQRAVPRPPPRNPTGTLPPGYRPIDW